MSRAHILIALIACYVLVSAVAYSDYPRVQAETPLSPLERQGLEVWRRNNCQVCHQIFGFGGFHGPDLTNVVTDDVDDLEITTTIRRGLGRMPAFDFSDREMDAIVAFLRKVHTLGQSQPAPLAARRTVEPSLHFAMLLDAAERHGMVVPEAARRGCKVWGERRCGACHVPFAEGVYRAPDLTGRYAQRSKERMQLVFQTGLGRMPVYNIPEAEVACLAEFLEFIAGERAALAARNLELLDHERFAWGDVPWFEYRVPQETAR